jgi:ABC-type nitrate/sulfonate/bicarbonate transport system substrate-binding protein
MRSRHPILLMLALLASCLPAAAQPVEVRTQLGWLRNGEFAPIMVAEAKGLFAEEGLRHRILDGGPGKNPVPIVAAGQAHFGSG